MQNNDSSNVDERRRRFAARVASALDIYPEHTDAELIEMMLRDGGWAPPGKQSGTPGQEPSQVVRSSEWVAEVEAALSLLEAAKVCLRTRLVDDGIVTICYAEKALRKALASEPRPSATDRLHRLAGDSRESQP